MSLVNKKIDTYTGSFFLKFYTLCRVGGYKIPLKNIKQCPENLEIKITNFDFFLILVVGTHWLESKIEKSLKITRKTR